MSTTLKNIEDIARGLLDDKDEVWKDKDAVFPWIHRGRVALRSIRPDAQLSSDGASLTTLTELTDKDDVIVEPDRFAECLAWYVVYGCRNHYGASTKGNINKAQQALDRFKELALTT